MPTISNIDMLNTAVEHISRFNTTNRTTVRRTSLRAVWYATCPACRTVSLLPGSPEAWDTVECPKCNTPLVIEAPVTVTPEARMRSVAIVAGDHDFKVNDMGVDTERKSIVCRCGWHVGNIIPSEVHEIECRHLFDMFDQVSHGGARFNNIAPVNPRVAKAGDMVRLAGMTDLLPVLAVSPSGNGLEVKLGSGSQPAWIQRNAVVEAFRTL